MKLKREPRKQMRIKEAARLLDVSPSTFRNLIAERNLQIVQRKPGTTSPIKVFEAQIKEIAREWGIL
jgi:excisionase family DNA binding protein